MGDAGRAVAELRARGSLTLPGTESGAMRAARRQRRIVLVVMLAVAAFGIAQVIVGLVRGEDAPWALAALLGGFLVFVGGLAALFLVTYSRIHAFREEAEVQPVHLGADGVWLRGVGPLPWRFLESPRYERVTTKNEGRRTLPVMPLTPEGVAWVQRLPGRRRLLVGPKGYLRTEVTTLLLPGVAGLGEREVMEVFGAAHTMFGRRQ